jgi:hypothetical protein
MLPDKWGKALLSAKRSNPEQSTQVTTIEPRPLQRPSVFRGQQHAGRGPIGPVMAQTLPVAVV